MPRKYKPLATAWNGRQIPISPKLQAAWDAAHASLPPRYWLKELTQSYYELRTPWGFGLAVGESGVGLLTGCCREDFTGTIPPVAVCVRCGAATPIPVAFPRLQSWDGAEAWLEEALGYYGHDVLTATVSASIIPNLRPLGEASRGA